MKGHDWGILTLRLTAIYLFVQAFFWAGSALSVVAVGLTDLSSMLESPWKILRAEASVIVPTIFCYVVGLWYWRAAPRITAPIVVTDERPSIADERIAPILIAGIAIWGMVNLIPALRAIAWELLPVEELEVNEALDEMRRYKWQYECVACAVAGIAAFGSRSVVAMLIYTKRNIKFYRMQELAPGPASE